MDLKFYLVVFFSLFGFVAVMLSIRYLLNRRLERIEKKRRSDEEARQVSESNSGL